MAFGKIQKLKLIVKNKIKLTVSVLYSIRPIFTTCGLKSVSVAEGAASGVSELFLREAKLYSGLYMDMEGKKFYRH